MLRPTNHELPIAVAHKLINHIAVAGKERKHIFSFFTGKSSRVENDSWLDGKVAAFIFRND